MKRAGNTVRGTEIDPFESIRIPVTAVLTMNEAAALIRCSKAHLSNVLNGKVSGLPPLPRITLGRRTLIRRAALDGWLEQLEHVAQRR